MASHWNCFNCGDDCFDQLDRNPAYYGGYKVAVWCAVCAYACNQRSGYPVSDPDYLILKNGVVCIAESYALKATPDGPFIKNSITKQKEKPCQICNRNNDIGVKVCWSCGNKP